MTSEENKHIDLLSLFHYILSGFVALFSCLPFIHVLIGLTMITGGFTDHNPTAEQPPEFFGWIFVIIGSICILTGWAIAIGMLIAGIKLKQRSARLFCLVIAGVECMFMPFGSVLGIFTLLTLTRESVKQAFTPAPHERQES